MEKKNNKSSPPACCLPPTCALWAQTEKLTQPSWGQRLVSNVTALTEITHTGSAHGTSSDGKKWYEYMQQLTFSPNNSSDSRAALYTTHEDWIWKTCRYLTKKILIVVMAKFSVRRRSFSTHGRSLQCQNFKLDIFRTELYCFLDYFKIFRLIRDWMFRACYNFTQVQTGTSLLHGRSTILYCRVGEIKHVRACCYQKMSRHYCHNSDQFSLHAHQ